MHTDKSNIENLDIVTKAFTIVTNFTVREDLNLDIRTKTY